MMDIQEILKQLPHRYPFLLVDRVLELERNTRIKAIKNVTFNEPFFTGHFPGRPVMPGVLVVEALAQAGVARAVINTAWLGEQVAARAFELGADSAEDFVAQGAVADQVRVARGDDEVGLEIGRASCRERVSSPV